MVTRAVKAKNAHLFEHQAEHWYVEEPWCTRRLLDVEGRPRRVWDPACGGGNIINEVYAWDARNAARGGAKNGIHPDGMIYDQRLYADILSGVKFNNFHIGSDIVRRTEELWFVREMDFLAIEGEGKWHGDIITNPPYFGGRGTEAFIRQALRRCSGKVSVFVDLKFLASSRRANGLWQELPPTRVWILAPRPSCPAGDYIASGGKVGGGTADYCWLVYDRLGNATTELRWLNKE